MAAERNPVFIPEKVAKAPKCPKCGSEKYSGRRIQGTVVFQCACGNEWSGAFAMSPATPDPRVPVAPEKYVPPLQFDSAQVDGKQVEIRKKIDPTPEFRKGARIPDEGEE